MNVLFIYTLYNIASINKPLRTPELMQFGISYISSYLKEHSHNTELIVLSRTSAKKNEQIIDEYINVFKPKVIAFTAVSTEYDFITSTAKYIRKRFPDVYLLIGGPHVSLNPEGVLENFDALCVGEGESPMLELVSQLEKNMIPSGIYNLWIKHDSEIEKNPTRPFLQNLDILPFPDREMWDEWIDEDFGARYSVLLGRGCPFECTYCCNHALKKLASGKYTRFRSPANIVNEINEIVKKHPDKKELYLEVESIGVNKEWTLDLCNKLEQFNKTLKQPLSFGANIRITPNIDLKSIFHAFRKSNFRFVNIGLESGSERVRREILNRNYSNEDIVNAVKLAKEQGLQVSFLNMIGVPGETIDDFKETIEMNRRCLPDWVGYSIFYPYPGTRIYSLCKELIKKPLTTNMERGRAILDLPGFSKKQIEREYIWFEYKIYKNYKPLAQLLLQILNLKIKTNPYYFYLYRKLKNVFYIMKDVMS